MGFGAAIQQRRTATLDLPVENRLKAIFNEALAQVFHRASAHSNGFDDLPVGPAAMRVKKRLGPFPFLRGMLSFVKDLIELCDFLWSQCHSVDFLHGLSSGPS
jgi:hypothetical protein